MAARITPVLYNSMIKLKSMSYKTRYPGRFFFLPLLVSIVLWSGAVDSMADQVAATLQQQAQNLNLEVSVTAPPPASLIAVMELPPQTKIQATSPRNAKLDPKNSQIKWLVKNPRTGTLRFSVTVSKPTDLAKVSAEILYRKPGGGKLIKIDAQKR